MKTLFKLIMVAALIALVAAIALPSVAKAQEAKTYATSLNGGTNNIAATATNTYAITQNVSEFDNVGATLNFKSTGANTGTQVVRIARSWDNGSTYESTPGLSLSVAANGTSTVVAGAKLDCSGVTNLKIVSWENPGASPITNAVVKFRPTATKVYAVPSTQ